MVQKSLSGEAAELAASREIHRCFERVNQLLSLLVPVSDINRAAAGRVAALSLRRRLCQKILGGQFLWRRAIDYIPDLPNPKRANGEV
jgi:hypothetical protein